jgi:hypothetical protein
VAEELGEQWRAAFWELVQLPEHSTPLRTATEAGELGDWTRELTNLSVETCESMGWTPCAKGHRSDLLPECRSEYLTLDVVAFEETNVRWPFPVAAMELENQQDDDRIAYSLWKVLCCRAKLRVVFCYRDDPNAVSSLVSGLQNEVIGSLDVQDRIALTGETIVAVGSRDLGGTFPYDFLKWWRLETNTGRFELMR